VEKIRLRTPLLHTSGVAYSLDFGVDQLKLLKWRENKLNKTRFEAWILSFWQWHTCTA